MGDLQRQTLRLNRLLKRLEQTARDQPLEAPSNCAAWAAGQRARHGGAYIILASEYGPWFHVQWLSPAGQVWEYAPDEPKYRQREAPTEFHGHPKRIA